MTIAIAGYSVVGLLIAIAVLRRDVPPTRYMDSGDLLCAAILIFPLTALWPFILVAILIGWGKP